MKLVKKELLFLIIVTFIFLLYTVFYPNIITNDMEIELGSNYTFDYECYNLFTNLTYKTVSTGNIDTNKVGSYKINVSIKYLFYNVNKNFIVRVVDKIPPDIELKGDNPAYVCPNKDYIEEGYNALDNYDGDITDKVDAIIDKDNILYRVFDSSFNRTEVKRDIIHEDKINPSIELKGKRTIYIYEGNSYIEAGYTAFDNCDGDITDKVVSTGNVDTNTIGTYNITYEVKDSSGNSFNTDREVIVIKKPNYYGNGVIYLTFDDGPSYLTNEILDILDREGIKATFFVCGANESTKRAYNSGHTIGLHSNTHNYSYIYTSSDNYFNDLNNISDKVFNVINIRSNIIRFPGGSSNTISRKYNRGIMSYLTAQVVNRGYNYFDWNVDSNDAGSDINNSSNIYYNVINNVSHNKANVVLMHDSANHRATVNALSDIIRYGKNNGYTFKAIDDNTPIIRHRVNN